MADKSSDQYAKSGVSSYYQGDRQQSTGASAAQQMQDISNQIETAKERIKATSYASALHILRSLPNKEDDKIQLDCLFLVALCETMTEQNISEDTDMKILSLCHRLSLNWQELWKMARNASGSLEVVFSLYTMKLFVSRETPDAALKQIEECINRTLPAINAMITKGEVQEAHKLVSIMHAILEEARKITGGTLEIRIHTQAKCLNKIGLIYNRLSMHGTAVKYLHEGRICIENFFGQRVAQYSIYSEILGNIAAAYAGEAEFFDASLYYDEAYKILKGNKTAHRIYREKYLQTYEVEFRNNIMKAFRKDPSHARNLQQSSSFQDSGLLPKIASDAGGADKKGTIRAAEERSLLQYKDVESESFSSEIEEIIRTPRKIRVDVATAGRTIELHGCKLKFPTGAFEETTPVEMVVGSQGAMPDGDLVPFTPILTCKLFGAQPKLPVAVEMPVYCLVDNDASIVVMCCKRHSNEWIHIKGAVMNTTNQTIEFEVAHFCTFAGYFRKMMKGMSMFSSRYNLHHQLYYNREKVAFIAMTYISTKEDENYKKPLEKPEVEQLMDLPHIISAKSGDKIKVKLMCGVPLEPPESPIPDPDDLLEKKYDLKYIVLKHKQIPHGCQTFMKYVIKINEEIREEKTLPSPLIPPSVPGQPDDNRGYHTDDIAEFNLKPAERHDYERHHEDSQYYQIPDHKVKGKVLILNNFFFGNQEMARVGSEIDVKKMTTLWTALGLNVTMKPNMSAEMMRNEVKSFAQNIGEVCLCVVIIMSHGLEQRGKVAIMCEDSTVVLFEEIIRQFDDDICAHLRGVPKLFFFDCDCGDRVLTQDTAGPVTEPPPPRQDTEPPPPRQHSEWPNNDRLVANAMRRTFVAFRNEAVGGWFIDAITNIFKEKACNTSVSDMMNLVNNAVSQRSCTDWACPQVYQMPQYESTLQKVLFLFPGWPKATYPLKDLGPTIQETEKHPIHTENKSKPPMLKRRSSSTISPSSDMQPTAEELSTFLVAVIDPGGGSVGLHGCSISVPEGSFSHSSNVKLSVYTGHDSLPAKYLLVSPVIHCASELPLKKSVTLQLPLWVSSKDPTVKIRIVRKGDEDNAEWEEIQTFNLCEISQRMIQVECRLSWAAAIMELLFGRVDYHIKTNLYHDMEGNFTTVFHFDEDTLAEKFRKQMIEKGKKCSPPTFKNHTVHLNDKITFSMTVEPEEYTFDFDKHEFHITEDFLHNKYASRDSMIEPDPTSIKTAVKFETNINGKKEDYGSFRINWNVQSAAASAPPSIINAQNVVTGPGHIRSTAESCTSLVKKS